MSFIKRLFKRRNDKPLEDLLEDKSLAGLKNIDTHNENIRLQVALADEHYRNVLENTQTEIKTTIETLSTLTENYQTNIDTLSTIDPKIEMAQERHASKNGTERPENIAEMTAQSRADLKQYQTEVDSGLYPALIGYMAGKNITYDLISDDLTEELTEISSKIEDTYNSIPAPHKTTLHSATILQKDIADDRLAGKTRKGMGYIGTALLAGAIGWFAGTQSDNKEQPIPEPEVVTVVDTVYVEKPSIDTTESAKILEIPYENIADVASKRGLIGIADEILGIKGQKNQEEASQYLGESNNLPETNSEPKDHLKYDIWNKRDLKNETLKVDSVLINDYDIDLEDITKKFNQGVSKDSLLDKISQAGMSKKELASELYSNTNIMNQSNSDIYVSIDDIVELTGVDKSGIYKSSDVRRSNILAEQKIEKIDSAKDYRSQGMTYSQIADELDLSASTARRYVMKDLDAQAA